MYRNGYKSTTNIQGSLARVTPVYDFSRILKHSINVNKAAANVGGYPNAHTEILVATIAETSDKLQAQKPEDVVDTITDFEIILTSWSIEVVGKEVFADAQ